MLHGESAKGRGAGVRRRLVLGMLATLALAGGTASGQSTSSQAAARQPVPVDVYSPPITGGPWINTPGGKAIDLEDRKGKVTILHFWTFG